MFTLFVHYGESVPSDFLEGSLCSKLRRDPRTKASPRFQYYIACGYALCAWSAAQNEWRNEQSEADSPSPTQFVDKAFEALQIAIKNGWNDRFELETNPELDAIRGDARFEQLLAQLSAQATAQ